MNDRYEYIASLERALVGQLSPDELSDIITYYKDYINSEMIKGKSEEEVLNMLGEPKLLAKSILAAHTTQVDENEFEEHRKPAWWSYLARNKAFIQVILVALAILLVILGIIIVLVKALWPLIVIAIIAGLIVKVFRTK